MQRLLKNKILKKIENKKAIINSRKNKIQENIISMLTKTCIRVIVRNGKGRREDGTNTLMSSFTTARCEGIKPKSDKF